MKFNTLTLNVFVLSFFVFNVLAMPHMTREALGAGSEAGAAQTGAEAGAATAAGVTTGTIAAGAAIAAAAALAIATSGGEGRVVPAPGFPLPPSPNPAVVAAAAELLQTLETNDLALLATAVTALGTTGSTALAQAANTLGTTEFQDLATLTANLDQSTVSGLASAMTVEALGSSQGGIAPTTAFGAALTTADITAVVNALKTDLGTVPLAGRDSLTPAQKNLYDYMAGLRANAQQNAALKNAFNGAYNALDKVKSNTNAVAALANLVNSTSGAKSDLSAINSLLTLIASSPATLKATQDLFKTTDPAEIAAIKKAFGLTVKPDGTIDSYTLTALRDLIKDTGTGTSEEIIERVRQALLALLTSQHPGYTVIVTTVHHGNNIYSTVTHIRK